MRAPASVLMTADTVGGVFSYAIELARALGRHGVRVVLATMGGPLSRAQREEARGIEIHEGDHRLEWMDDPWDDVARAGEWLLDLASRVAPDVLHLNGYAHAALPFRVPKVVVAHSCVLSWYRAVHGCAAPPRWERYRREVARGLAAADAVVAPTGAMLDAVVHHYGAIARGWIIPNARDPGRYRPAMKEPFILAAGRVWDEAKNIAALGSVAPRLSWPVRVAGSDLHPDGTRRTVPGIEALGVVSPPDLAALLGRASIYALPARYEPFGLSILEAALSGCALVLGDIPSLRELWEGAAVFVDPDDAERIGSALGALVQDAHARQALGSRARARAASFTPARMAARYFTLYGELCRARTSERCA